MPLGSVRAITLARMLPTHGGAPASPATKEGSVSDLTIESACTVFIVIGRRSPSDGKLRPPWPPRCSTCTL